MDRWGNWSSEELNTWPFIPWWAIAESVFTSSSQALMLLPSVSRPAAEADGTLNKKMALVLSAGKQISSEHSCESGSLLSTPHKPGYAPALLTNSIYFWHQPPDTYDHHSTLEGTSLDHWATHSRSQSRKSISQLDSKGSMSCSKLYFSFVSDTIPIKPYES